MSDAPGQRGSPGRFGWGFFFVFFSLFAAILGLIGRSLADDTAALQARLAAAESGASGERVVVGTVRPASGTPLLRAPASGQRCVAWETRVEVSFPEEDSDGDEHTRTRTLRHGEGAMPFDVDDPRAGLVAVVDQPLLELLAPDAVTELPDVPAWADALAPVGSDSTSSRRTYAARERTLNPGNTVTLVGALATGDAPRLSPGPGRARVTAYRGGLEAWREEARGQAKAAWWLQHIGLGLAALAALMLVGLLRTFLPARR